MKKLIKILPILMVILMIMTTCAPVLGKQVGSITINPNTNSSTQVAGIGNNILGIIQVVGTIIAVGVLMVIGIKYMMGSAEEKAEYKKTLMPYVIGAGLVFAASSIAQIVYQFMQNV